MTEVLFDKINYYMRAWDSNGFWGAWTDVTSNIMDDPRPRGSVGLRNNELMDKFADGGEMTVAIKNDGTYSAVSSGLITKVIALRFTTTWDGVEKVKFEGVYKPNSMKINWDALNNKYMELTFIDFITWVTDYPLDNIEYQINMDVTAAVRYMLNQLSDSIRLSQQWFISNPGASGAHDTYQVDFAPGFKDFETGIYTFPDVFDLQNKRTTIGGEWRRLIESELGYLYQKYEVMSDPTWYNNHWMNVLTIENREHRRFPLFGNGAYDSIPVYSGDHDGDRPLLSDGSSFPLLSDGTSFPLLSDSASITIDGTDLMVNGQNDFVFDAHGYNFFRVKTRPRKVDADATTVLWTMENSTLIAAGGTVSGLRGQYRDPNGGASYVNCIEITPPVANTDFKAYSTEGTTGTDLTGNLYVKATRYPAEADFLLINQGTQGLYTGGDILFQLRGKGVYQYDTTDVVVDLRDYNTRFISDKLYPIGGVNEYSMDLYYKTDVNDIVDVIDYTNYWSAYPRINPQSIELLANKDTNNMRLWLYGDVGACFRLDVDSATIAYDDAVYINGYSFEVIEGKYIKWQIIPFEQKRAIMTRT